MRIQPSPRLLFALAIASCTTAGRAEEITVVPHQADAIYERGEKAGWTVTREKDSLPGPYSYALKKNNFEILETGELDFLSGQTSVDEILDEPAMLFLEIRAGGEHRRVVQVITQRAAASGL